MCRALECLWAIAATIWFVAVVSAQPPLVIDDSGYHQLRFDEDGSPYLKTIDVVIDRTDGNPPDDPDDPGDDDDGDVPTLDTEMVQLAKAQAQAIDDPRTAQAIASVYSHTRDLLLHDEIAKEDVFGRESVLKQATDRAIAECQNAKDWEPFRDAISEKLSEWLSRDKLETKLHHVIALASVQEGLELSLGEDGAAISIDEHTQVGRITREAIR